MSERKSSIGFRSARNRWRVWMNVRKMIWRDLGEKGRNNG